MNNNPEGVKCTIFVPEGAEDPPPGAPKCELLRKVPGVMAI